MALGLRAAMEPGSLSLSSLQHQSKSAQQGIRRQAAQIFIDRKFSALGGLTGAMGLPFGELRDRQENGAFFKTYSGGRVELMDFSDGPQGVEEYRAEVRLVGFRVLDTNDASADEPYLVVTITGSNDESNVTKRSDIQAAQVKSDNNVVLHQLIAGDAQPPFQISIVAFDHDSGDPDEAAAKVEQALKDVAAKLMVALPMVGVPIAVGAYIVSFANIFGDWIGKGVSWLFGMGDDVVGQDAHSFFNFDEKQLAWKTDPPLSDPDFPEPHNAVFRCNNGGDGGGNYKVFLNVQMFKLTRAPI